MDSPFVEDQDDNDCNQGQIYTATSIGVVSTQGGEMVCHLQLHKGRQRCQLNSEQNVVNTQDGSSAKSHQTETLL